ncbi:AAA family ATPase [Paenibacillus sp. M2]
MLIKEVYIGKYKKIKDFKLEFSKMNNSKFNLSVLIGENGTAKTSILQAITNLLSDSKEKHKMLDAYMKYELSSDEQYLLSTIDIPIQLPSKLVISSYTPIERVYIQAKYSKSSYCPIIYSEMGLSKLKYVIKEYVCKHSSKMHDIVDYIGYIPSAYYLEFNIIGFTTNRFRENLFRGLYDEILKVVLPNLNQNLSMDELIDEYDYEIRSYDNSTKKFRKFVSEYMQDLFKDDRYYAHKSAFSINQLERVLVEYLYVNMKIKAFSSAFSKKRETYYKGEVRKLVDSADIINYFEGEFQFYNDIKFLGMFDRYVISDLWFYPNSDHSDIIPLSYWSSGELSLFLRLVEIAHSVSENSVLLIDEPETHLHPKWINGYINILKDIIDVNCHVIIATHAPLIVSDIPKENIILLKKNGTAIYQDYIEEQTIGLEYDGILKKIFDVEEKEGTVLESYEKKILQYIEENNINSAIELYDQLGDSPTKFQLFLKLKKIYEARNED